MAISTTNSKIVSLFILLVISLVVSLIPLRFHKVVSRSGTQVFIRFLSCIAGGIIFGTCLLHLLPEVKESFVGYTEEAENHIEYPVSEMMVGVGFMMIFLLEQVIGACRKEHTSGKHCYVSDVPSSAHNLVAETFLDQVAVGKDETDAQNGERVQEGKEVQGVTSDMSVESGHDHGHSHGVEFLVSNPGIKEYAFASALCLHALFEGLALGFLDTSNHVFQLLLGVSLHKATIAITLVIQLVRSRVKWKASVTIALIFAFITPIGIAIGTGVEATGSTESTAGTIAETILPSIGTGTLLYVVVMGIIFEEFGSGDRHLQKSLCFLAGYLLIAFLAFIPDHHHHDADHHSDDGNITSTTTP